MLRTLQCCMNFARVSPSFPPHLNFLRPRVDPFPQQPPTGQAVAIVTQVGFILASHINGDDRFGSKIAGNVRCWPLTHPRKETHPRGSRRKQTLWLLFCDKAAALTFLFRNATTTRKLHIHTHTIDHTFHYISRFMHED